MPESVGTAHRAETVGPRRRVRSSSTSGLHPDPGPSVHEPRPSGPAAWRALGWHLLAGVAFVGAALLGRASMLPDTMLALTWPAGGVACLWLYFSRGRELPAAALALGVVTYGVNAATGASAPVSAAFVASNVAQALVFTATLRVGSPQLWRPGLASASPLQGLDRMRPVAWTTVAALAGALAGAAVGAAGLYLAGRATDGEGLVIWTGRNFAGILAVFVLVHLIVRAVCVPSSQKHSSGIDWSTMVVLTVACYVPVFAQNQLPMAFLPTMCTLVIGLRSRPLVAGVHGVLAGSIAVTATILGTGPFMFGSSLVDRVLLVQLYVAIILIKVVFLAAAGAERREATAGLAAAEQVAIAHGELMESALDSMSDGLLLVGADGTILRSNRAGQAMLELIRAGGIQRAGSTPLMHLDGTSFEPEENPIVRAVAGETVSHLDLALIDREGNRRTFIVNGSPLRAEGAAKAVITFRDVTEERAQVDELAAFAGVVAHDLRGPLGAMLGWSELALQMVVDDNAEGVRANPQVVRALQRLNNGATKMDQLVEGLLLHATSRDRELTREPVDLRRLVNEIVEVRDLGSTVEIGEVPAVNADALMMHHLFDNLIGNAVKFVPEGQAPHVRIDGHVVDRCVELTVTDNGIGVPENMRRQVFHRFERVPGVTQKGTGLGLSICQTIVERHGGQIGIVNPPDGARGACFRVRLPAA
ncbi:ATP-binding protein [Nocardioides acrostichi]|nr:ATP-binding protein [Nocardioides acrostichi]